MSTHGLAPQLFVTQSAEEGPAIAARLCKRGDNPLIIVGGGDGTINGVANGLIPGTATLAVLPLGTANVLAKEIGIRSVDDAVARIVRGTTRPCAAGVVKGHEKERRFLLMAGVGFDARVVQQTRSAHKKILKQGAYLLAGLKCLWSWERDLLQVTLDGGETVACHSVVVCNAARYGGGFRLAPEADLFDPGFQVVCITDSTPAAIALLVAATIIGRPLQFPGIRRFPAARVAVAGKKPVQIDGDKWEDAPVLIEPIASFAKIIL